MTVAERTEMSGGGGGRDQFPIGMRVLAVDDNPICLKLLETLLLQCQYHVTTTNQAILALKMLRENKDQFDLVISDVHMPDMDGFKLLELVGLEMEIPVIMLSANGESQAVMKGITHGAVDYLLKPVRIKELKNIWQHVIRRKKVDTRDKNNVDSGDDCDNFQIANIEGGQGSISSGFSDGNERLSKKRKEQSEEADGDEENEAENDDPSSQKQPRVVWSVDLHRKFVAAVNQLGIDKAVPMRVLDLMNVEGLTRENVASHLQKYRLYLKRLSAVANQQANMVAALRGRDPSSYLPMGSLDGYPNFNSLVGNRPLPGSQSFQPNGALPRMNNLTGFGIHGFSPSGSGQLGRTLSTSNSTSDLGKHQGISLPTLQGSQNVTLLQGAGGRDFSPLLDGFSSKRMDMPVNRQPSFDAPYVSLDSVKINVDGHFNHKGEPLSEEMKSHSGFGSNGCSLDDLVNSMMKPIDSVISQAQASFGALVFQRSTFSGINSKLSNVSSRLPTVNHILSTIRRKKSMDTIMLSLVASVCTFLILIYWMSK